MRLFGVNLYSAIAIKGDGTSSANLSHRVKTANGGENGGCIRAPNLITQVTRFKATCLQRTTV